MSQALLVSSMHGTCSSYLITRKSKMCGAQGIVLRQALNKTFVVKAAAAAAAGRRMGEKPLAIK